MEFIPPKQTTSTGLRIYFIRHAESLNNIRYNADPNKYKEARSHDPDLSLKGYEQATQLAAYIKGNEQFRDVCESNFLISPLQCYG